jgi:hypothetical protein
MTLRMAYIACPGTGPTAKKYSVESSKPVKFPRGATRPTAVVYQHLPAAAFSFLLPLALKSPGGTEDEPCFRKATLLGYEAVS